MKNIYKKESSLPGCGVYHCNNGVQSTTIYAMTQRHYVQNEEIMFVTTNTANRRRIFENPAYAREAVECLYRVQDIRPFLLFGFVIMPDHCHFLVRIPEPETISRIMNSYKSAVAKSIGIGPMWQARFFLDIPRKTTEIIRYIHLNPVRAHLVEQPDSYPWSSASGKWDITPLDMWAAL